MKISNSKKELARIISENGGWRDGEFAAQDSNKNIHGARVCFYNNKPCVHGDEWWDGEYGFDCIEGLNAIKNWHQTILSRAEYFHLYPDSDAKPRFCESVMRSIPEPSNNPTIEQLAADYRNLLDFAQRKQQEADDAKADADARLKALELACEAIGLVASPITAKQEPELVITDWRDLQVGDVIKVYGGFWEPDCEYVVDENDLSEDMPVKVGGYWAEIGSDGFEFIRRP